MAVSIEDVRESKGCREFDPAWHMLPREGDPLWQYAEAVNATLGRMNIRHAGRFFVYYHKIHGSRVLALWEVVPPWECSGICPVATLKAVPWHERMPEPNATAAGCRPLSYQLDRVLRAKEEARRRNAEAIEQSQAMRDSVGQHLRRKGEDAASIVRHVCSPWDARGIQGIPKAEQE